MRYIILGCLVFWILFFIYDSELAIVAAISGFASIIIFILYNKAKKRSEMEDDEEDEEEYYSNII